MKYRGPLAKPLAEKQPPKRICSRRPETAKQDREYNARVKVWLAQPENQTCKVFRLVPEFRAKNPNAARACQCHHLHGRGWRRELLMVEALWIPVSAEGHAWIDANRTKSIAYGLLAPKGQYNELPPGMK